MLIWLSTLVFAIIHSLLATRRCKRWAADCGWDEPRYRLLYTIVSLLLTAIWLLCIHALPDLQLFRAEGVLFYMLVVLQITGAIIIFAAFRPIDTMAFLGFRRSAHDVDPFVISGIYRYMRHPMYSGVILMLLASPLQSINSLSMTLAVALYFLIGSAGRAQDAGTPPGICCLPQERACFFAAFPEMAAEMNR